MHVLVSRDGDGRDLQIGDPVTLYYGGIANRGYVGTNSHGSVTGFGRVNIQVRISDSRSMDLIGTAVPVPGSHLKYGHVGYVRAADLIADTLREIEDAAITKRISDQTEFLRAVVGLATERAIITGEQAQELWLLRNEI